MTACHFSLYTTWSRSLYRACQSSATIHALARAHTHTRTHTSTLPLVFVNIKPQSNYLNMNCAFLYVNEWRRQTVLFSTCTKDYRIPKMKVLKRLCLYLHFCRLIKWGHKYMNCSESHFISIWPFNLSRTILIISYTHRNIKVFMETLQNKSWV